MDTLTELHELTLIYTCITSIGQVNGFYDNAEKLYGHFSRIRERNGFTLTQRPKM